MRELDEEGDGRVRVEGERRHPVVVDLGEAVAVGRRSVLLDGLDPTSETGLPSAPLEPAPARSATRAS
jgi:hypothetical protein